MQTTVAVAVVSWGDSMRASLANALSIFFAAVPRVIAFFLILLIGWFFASLFATTLINTLLIGVVGALALALGLSFGLGGREKAASLIERWPKKTEDAAQRSSAPLKPPSIQA